jgi:hypothetical protein
MRYRGRQPQTPPGRTAIEATAPRSRDGRLGAWSLKRRSAFRRGSDERDGQAPAEARRRIVTTAIVSNQACQKTKAAARARARRAFLAEQVWARAADDMLAATTKQDCRDWVRPTTAAMVAVGRLLTSQATTYRCRSLAQRTRSRSRASTPPRPSTSSTTARRSRHTTARAGRPLDRLPRRASRAVRPTGRRARRLIGLASCFGSVRVASACMGACWRHTNCGL